MSSEITSVRDRPPCERNYLYLVVIIMFVHPLYTLSYLENDPGTIPGIYAQWMRFAAFILGRALLTSPSFSR